MKKLSLFFIAGAAFTGCITRTIVQPAANASQPEKPGITIGGKLFTSAFLQHAAEYKALCHQAFNIARYQLDDALKTTHAKPLAIVTDIDETLVDNSPYAVQRGLNQQDYSVETWYDWTSKGMADTLAGSVSFLKYAASKGVTIFYITNRDEVERPGTIANLKKFGFPFADDAHLILRSGESSKEKRRLRVSETHEIVMLMGDNLADFSSVFDKKSTADRNQQVRENASLFGKKFIVLPNPTYGDWESALFHYNHKLTTQQKDSAIREAIKGY